MSMYYENRKRARTVNNSPTLTEQSMARDTDINVIVAKFRITGRVPGAQQQPMGGDFTALPTDLRGFIDAARDLRNHRMRLPKELANIPTEELLRLTTAELKAKLNPPEEKPPEGT